MSFATSAADFGIKSSAGARAAAFGATNQQQQQGQQQQQQPSIFGGPILGQNPTVQSQTQASVGNPFLKPPQEKSAGGFGATSWPNTNAAAPNTTQPAANLFSGFGQNNQNQQQQPSSTGLGGGNSLFNSQQQQPGGISNGTSVLGNPGGGNAFNNTTGQQLTTGVGTGGSFFSNPSNQQQVPTQTQNTSSIFTNLGGQQQPAGSSIFGNPLGQQQQPAGSNIFGNSLGQQQQPISNSFGGSSIFNNTGTNAYNQQQPQQPAGGMWGAAPTSAPAASQQQPQQPQFTKATKFNDLPEQTQKLFETIDTYIQGRMQISKDLKTRSLKEEPARAAEIIRRVHMDLLNTTSTLQADKSAVDELRLKVDGSVQDTIITTRIMDGFKNPQQNGAYLKNHANFPLEFFSRATEEIRQKLQWYKSTIEQIERRLVSAQNQVQYNPQAITATLQAQNATFIGLAGKTAEIDAELQKIKSQYRQLWKMHTGSDRDPFNELDRRPGDGGGLLNGLGSMNLSR